MGRDGGAARARAPRPAPGIAGDMDDLLSEFLTECFEGLAALDAELLGLERRPDDPDRIASIFRIVHTIKGTCGFLGLPRLERVAHAAENVLGDFREGKLVPGPSEVTLI